jgi:hypothetical protein
VWLSLESGAAVYTVRATEPGEFEVLPWLWHAPDRERAAACFRARIPTTDLLGWRALSHPAAVGGRE